jgi:hypothetical protein
MSTGDGAIAGWLLGLLATQGLENTARAHREAEERSKQQFNVAKASVKNLSQTYPQITTYVLYTGERTDDSAE